MIESLRTRWAIILVVLTATIIWTLPNFINVESIWWPTKARMVLGLDIQGGSHLVLRVDVDSAIKQDATRLAAQLPDEMKEEKTPIQGVTMIEPLRGHMKIDLLKPEDRGGVEKTLDKFYGNTVRVLKADGNALEIEYSELHIRDFKNRLLEQAIATIRNRIDEFGVAEPSITAQGSDRILVQLPGIKDAATAKDLINRTARLDFMIVSTEINQNQLQSMVEEVEKTQNINIGDLKYSQYVDKINEALKDKLPQNTVVYFEKPENAVSMEVARLPYLLSTTAIVAGDKLTSAQVGMGERGEPVVSFAFDPVGARLFADLTRKHTNELMAIVLDKVVKSAPVIRSPITGGRGQIELGRSRDPQQTMNEAKVIATSLRAGALPAALEQLEERTVGPSLGADAIRQGQVGSLVSALAVFSFMVFYYKAFGIVANLSLAFNILVTIAILSSLGATLTLPGIAGLALTLGMSVDANVIIYERVKEEMGKGASLYAAIREGYDRAFSSIFDSIITSIAVCIVLMYFGTGPVRGFAITLLAGLVTSLFTAIFFTRAVFDLLVGRWKWNMSVK